MHLVEGRLDRDQTEQRARDMIADVTRFGRSIGIMASFRYPAFHAPEIEMTDLNAKHELGTGAGTKFMAYLCQKADEADFNLYVQPATGRNKTFYERFGFERSNNHPGGILVRYVEMDWDDDDRAEYDAMRRKALGEPDLDEEVRFPLAKGVLGRARGSYGALVCVMNPKDFLRLTTVSDADLDHIVHKDEFAPSVAAYKNVEHPVYNKTQYGMPYLNVDFDSGKVLGHEGRHRAAMVMREGGTKFPCVLFFKSSMEFEVSYFREPVSVVDGEVIYGKGEHLEQMFKSQDAAQAFIDGLKKENDNVDGEFYNSEIKNHAMGGSTMKGSPRSNPSEWKYDAWKPEDMPNQLVGQFNDSVIVPKSRLRVGLVKGYSHYR